MAHKMKGPDGENARDQNFIHFLCDHMVFSLLQQHLLHFPLSYLHMAHRSFPLALLVHKPTSHNKYKRDSDGISWDHGFSLIICG